MHNGLFKRGLLKNGKNKNFFEFDGEKMVRFFLVKKYFTNEDYPFDVKYYF
jgi:hypothetical protein